MAEALGHPATVYEFYSNDLTPELENYFYNENGIEGNPDEVPGVIATPYFNDQYLNVGLMLPRRVEEARGCVTKRVHDNYGNTMGRSNTNPILESRQCVFKFEDGNEAKLAANDISQSMYAQCDPDDNQYLLLDSIVDFRRSTTDLCHGDHKLVSNGLTYLNRLTAR